MTLPRWQNRRENQILHQSRAKLGFSKDKCDVIKEEIINIFGKVPFQKSDYPNIIHLLKFDKKNEHGNINFVLLEDVGATRVNCHVDNELILEAFEYYLA